MNIQLFSKQLLEEALRSGTLTLEDGTIRELKASEILGVAKYIVSNNLTTETEAKVQSNMPSEMFDTKQGALEEIAILLDLDQGVINGDY